MAKIKPKTITEIQENLNRPFSLDKSSKEDVFKYMKRLEKTVNSRIRRLRAKVPESGTLAELYRQIDFVMDQDPITEAGFINMKKGSIFDYMTAVRAMENFIREKGSTITGLKELSEEFLGMFERGMGVKVEDLGKLERASKLASSRDYDLSDLYWVAIDIKKSGGDLNDYIREIDGRWLVDRDLEDLLETIWNTPNVQEV